VDAVVRTCIELAVLLTGWLLGGTVGIGTVVYAGCLGPLAHVFTPALEIPTPEEVDEARRPQERVVERGV
jgi:uncharacterized membrane protein YczE